MSKTRQNENGSFQTMTNRDDSQLGRCDACDPTHSSELRRASWLTFDAAFGVGGQRALQAWLARLCLVSLASIVG